MKKRVLFLIPNLAHGGAEHVLVNLVNNLSREKYEITVQTLFDFGVYRQYLLPHIRYIPGIKQQVPGYSHIQKLFSPKRLYVQIIRSEYEIIVSYLEGTTARIVSGCQASGKKTVCWIHTEVLNEKIFSRCFRSMAEAQNGYTNIDQIISVSESVKSSIELYAKFTHAPKVLYNTNETDIIKMLSNESVTDISLDNNDYVICSVGKILKVKGFDRLLNVHKRLLDEGYPHKVYILGTGEEQKKMESRIREYGVEKSFILLGFRENPYKYIARSDLYVCSSRREGFSTAVTEALIVGTPVVSTDCSGARELLGEHDEYGLVVENSEDGIFDGIKRMFSNPILLSHYKEKAKECGGRFSKERTVKAVEEMFDGL